MNFFLLILSVRAGCSRVEGNRKGSLPNASWYWFVCTRQDRAHCIALGSFQGQREISSTIAWHWKGSLRW
jgi:hypothetical protein